MEGKVTQKSTHQNLNIYFEDSLKANNNKKIPKHKKPKPQTQTNKQIKPPKINTQPQTSKNKQTNK